MIIFPNIKLLIDVKWNPVHENIFTSCDESGRICTWNVN